MPACEEHLKSKYLVFESNCDGDLDTYLTGLATKIPHHLDAIWSHCTGYPGARDVPAFLRYMKACQIDTTFFFAGENKMMVTKTLKEFEELLDEYDFIRVHNSHLINLNHVAKYTKGEGGVVTMSDGAEVDVSRRKKEEFLQRLTKL